MIKTLTGSSRCLVFEPNPAVCKTARFFAAPEKPKKFHILPTQTKLRTVNQILSNLMTEQVLGTQNQKSDTTPERYTAGKRKPLDLDVR